MKQANANGVRGNWNDSYKGGSHGTTRRQAHSSPLLALSGQARQLSAPLWSRFLRSEGFLRRSIPVLIIVLLVLVAGARTGSLLGSAQRLQEDSKQQISLLSELLTLRLESQSASQSLAEGIETNASAILLETALACCKPKATKT